MRSPRRRGAENFFTATICCTSSLVAAWQEEWDICFGAAGFAALVLIPMTAKELAWIYRGCTVLTTQMILERHPVVSGIHCALLSALGALIAQTFQEHFVFTMLLTAMSLHQSPELPHRALVVLGAVGSLLYRFSLFLRDQPPVYPPWSRISVAGLQALVLTVVGLSPFEGTELSDFELRQLWCQWFELVATGATLASIPLFVYSAELDLLTDFTTIRHLRSMPQVRQAAADSFCAFCTLLGCTSVLMGLLNRLWGPACVALGIFIVGSIIRPRSQALSLLLRTALSIQTAAVIRSWLTKEAMLKSSNVICFADWLETTEALWLVLEATHAVGAITLCESFFEQIAQCLLSFGLSSLQLQQDVAQLIALLILVGAVLVGMVAMRMQCLLSHTDRDGGSVRCPVTASACVGDI